MSINQTTIKTNPYQNNINFNRNQITIEIDTRFLKAAYKRPDLIVPYLYPLIHINISWKRMKQIICSEIEHKNYKKFTSK